jgi:hypothetical protein
MTNAGHTRNQKYLTQRHRATKRQKNFLFFVIGFKRTRPNFSACFREVTDIESNVLPIVNSQSNSYLRDMTEYGDLNRRGDVLFVTDKVLEKIKAKDDAYAHSQSSKDSRQQDLLLYCLCGGPR